jgi:raffinose/stachyose/melibiose transport system substrate-binding protein
MQKSKAMKPLFALLIGAVMIGTAACQSANSSSTAPASTAPASTASTASTDSSASSADTTPVTYHLMVAYSQDSEKAPADWAVAQLKKEFPNVTIQITPQLQDNGVSLKAQIATGDVPDFFSISPDQMPDAIQVKAILDLTSAATQYNVKADMTPLSVANQLTYTDGKVWAIPFAGTQVDLLFYNKKLFADNNIKVPTNFPEFLTAVQSFKKLGITPIALDGKEYWPIGAFFDSFAMRVNPQGMLALNNGTAKASDADYTDCINKMAQLISAGCFQAGATNTDYDAERALFHGGKAAMMYNGEWELSDGVTAMGADEAYLDVFPTTDPGNEAANKYCMPGAAEMGGIAVSAKAQDPTLAAHVACELAKFLSQGNYVTQNRTDGAWNNDNITPNTPNNDLETSLIAAKVNYQVHGTVEHSLPNQSFSTGFGEELQKFVAGESAATFIKNVDALQASTVNQ